MKNLVLTYCVGYSQEIYDRFIGTLFDTGFAGDLVMFVGETDMSKTIKYKNIYKNRVDFRISYQIPLYHAQTQRYIIYKDYLKNIDKIYDFVFICDSRDMLFQKDIFKADLVYYDFYVFEEEDKTIGECQYNSGWIKGIFNAPVFDALKSKPIICSGTILGKTQAMVQYLNIFTDILPSLKNLHYVGGDQGIHNFLIHENKLPIKIKILTNDDNIVNTVGYGFKGLNDKDEVVNKNNEVSYCVHQYDRFPIELRERLTKKYKYNFID